MKDEIELLAAEKVDTGKDGDTWVYKQGNEWIVNYENMLFTDGFSSKEDAIEWAKTTHKMKDVNITPFGKAFMMRSK